MTESYLDVESICFKSQLARQEHPPPLGPYDPFLNCLYTITVLKHTGIHVVMYISKVYLGQLNLFSFQMRIKQHVISLFLFFFFRKKLSGT